MLDIFVPQCPIVFGRTLSYPTEIIKKLMQHLMLFSYKKYKKLAHFTLLNLLKFHNPTLIQDRLAIKFQKKIVPLANLRPYGNLGH